MSSKMPHTVQSMLPAAVDPSLPEFNHQLKDLSEGRFLARAKHNITVQLGASGEARMRSEYGLSSYGDTKRGMSLQLTPNVETTIKALDKQVAEIYKANARTWFKGKDKRLTQHQLLKTDDEGNAFITVKVVCEGDHCTKIHTKESQDAPVEVGTIESLNRGCECYVRAVINHLWFTDDHYGVTLLAKVILTKPGTNDQPGIESMGLGGNFVWE